MSNDNFTFPAIHVNVTLEIGFIIALKRSILVERAVILETERSIKTLRYIGYIAAACGERNVKINGRYVHRISTKKHCVRHILINITHSQLMLSFVMPEKRYLRSDRKVDPSHKSCSAAGSQTKDAAFHSQWLRCKVLMTASAINHIMTQLSSTYWTHTHTQSTLYGGAGCFASREFIRIILTFCIAIISFTICSSVVEQRISSTWFLCSRQWV